MDDEKDDIMTEDDTLYQQGFMDGLERARYENETMEDAEPMVRIVLTLEEFDALLAELDKPEKPNAKLRELIQKTPIWKKET